VKIALLARPSPKSPQKINRQEARGAKSINPEFLFVFLAFLAR
jgi:hypothetical protein